MAHSEHLANLQKGVSDWNEWRKKNPETYINLQEANLRGAQLMEADPLRLNGPC
jgi:uncharacterized protein YjbI with pentapeptide repeats